ncbi:arsenate reductase/protein-tyrosine-phosphatase family protein [Geodermatophilus sp. SYSU D01119]
MPRHCSPEPVFTVLVVCTGNICRSPLAERLGRAYLDERLAGRAGEVELGSAGTRAVVGAAMHPDTALVLRGLGGDPAGFRARQVVDGMVIDADLTLTMTRAHRREVLALAPRALARTYTLREAADLIRIAGTGTDVPDRTPADRARRLVSRLNAARSRRHSGPEDDVQDPVGLSLEVHLEVGESVAAALIPLLDFLTGPPAS